MVCRSHILTGTDQPDRPWTNWAGTTSATLMRYVEPASLAELVEIVAQATESGHRLHALGSGWGFEDLAIADWVVNLGQLTSPLSYAVPEALTDAWHARQADPTADRRLFHVECGGDIGLVNEMLAAEHLGMITLGGANGQTLAGAVSTSTHGGDIDLPPLPDVVQALHLVTDGGRELWLERASAPITTDDRLRPVLPCPDTQIIRDDEIFNAALVSVGRFGVMYSMVIAVRPEYRLAEWTLLADGHAVRLALRAGQANGSGLLPLFELLAAPPAALGAIGAGTPGNERYLRIVYNAQDPSKCFVTRRWETTEYWDLNLNFDAQFPCNPGQPELVLGAAAGIIEAAAPGLAVIPVVGVVWAAQALLAGQSLAARALAQPPPDGGEAVALSLNAAWDNHLGSAVPLIAQEILSQQFATSTQDGLRGRSDLIMTGTRASNQTTCFQAESVETVFPAAGSDYLDFLDRILPASPEYDQAGVVALRYSAPSAATLSMHNLSGSLCVSIETASLKGLRGNAGWLAFIQQTALSEGGRAHWGQINALRTAEVTAMYGPQLDRWRRSLFNVSGQSSVFSNHYTQSRGLEPAPPTLGVDPVIVTMDVPVTVTVEAHDSVTWIPTAGDVLFDGTVVGQTGVAFAWEFRSSWTWDTIDGPDGKPRRVRRKQPPDTQGIVRAAGYLDAAIYIRYTG